MKKTTIQLKETTVLDLQRLRKALNETYDDIVSRLIQYFLSHLLTDDEIEKFRLVGAKPSEVADP